MDKGVIYIMEYFLAIKDILEDTRWQHRKTVNSPLLIDTLNTYVYSNSFRTPAQGTGQLLHKQYKHDTE